jgi:hypothetical protein
MPFGLGYGVSIGPHDFIPRISFKKKALQLQTKEIKAF